jgi:6-phosphogluconolactonase (cycloisomerase 2 family)
MTIGKWARLVLMAAPLLAGCKGFWDAPTSPGGGTGTTTASSGNFYVLNAQTSQVAAFYINAGVVTGLPGSPYALSAAPIAIAVAPGNAFLYVSTANGIYLYNISSNGQLTLGNSGGPISSDQAASMQVDATSSWLVEAVSGSSHVYAIPINPSTGVATSTVEQFVALPASTVQQLTISPDNAHVFIAMGAGGTASIPFTAGNGNPLGAVTSIAVKNSAGAALSVAVDPSNRIFYIGETVATSGSNTGGLRAFNLSTMKELSGSPYPSQGLAPYAILPISTGDYVYVANRQVSGSSTGVIAGFSIASSSNIFSLSVYSLTALGSTFQAGTNLVGLAEDNTGTFVLAVNFGGNPDLTGYTFDTTHAGYLDSVISSNTGTDPVAATAIAAAN